MVMIPHEEIVSRIREAGFHLVENARQIAGAKDANISRLVITIDILPVMNPLNSIEFTYDTTNSLEVG